MHNFIIPGFIDLDKLVAGCFPNDKRPLLITRHRDRFAYLIGTIYSHFLSDRDDAEDGARLNSRVLRIAIGNRYKTYVDYLEQSGIIIKSKSFRVGSSSNTYALVFQPKAQVKSCYHKLQDPTIRIGVTRSIKFRQEEMERRLKKVKHLTRFFNKRLNINLEEAKVIIQQQYLDDLQSGMDENLANDKRSTRIARVHKFQKGDFSLKVDSFSGRFHSSLTQLPRKLRSTIRFEGQKLCSIDISNSQFYMTNIFFESAFWLEQTGSSILHLKTVDIDYSLYHRPSREAEGLFIMCQNSMLQVDCQSVDVSLFRILTRTGYFYTYMHKKFLQECSQQMVVKYGLKDLSEVKRMMMRIAFDDSSEAQINKSPAHECHMIFREHFPSIAAIIQYLKKRDHRDVSRLLQKIERHIIIDLATKEMVEKHHLAVFTIHDCVVCKPQDLDLVRHILRTHLQQAIGLAPTLKVDYW